MKITAIIIIMVICAAYPAGAQNITNIVGTGGTYIIKNATTDFFTLTQSTGQIRIHRTLRLENTTNSTTGIIYLGTDRFIHNYGFGCLYFGVNSGSFNSTLFNTTFGHSTLFAVSGGSSNSVLGYLAMAFNSAGSNNSAFGYASLFFNSTGNHNSAFGHLSLVTNGDGARNSAFGDSALALNTLGNNNSAFGYRSLGSNVTGTDNTAFGKYSLNNSKGSFNTSFGHISGLDLTTGSNVTCIGYASMPSTGTVSNQFTLGNNTIQMLRCNVTSITSLSDARDKKNIRDLNIGLDLIMKLKPRIYNWDKREWYETGIADGTKMKDVPTAGFIAQELDEAQINAGADWLNLVMKDNPEKWEATPGNLLPVIIKALQEVKIENERLKNEHSELIAANSYIEQQLTEMEQTQKKLAVEIQKDIKSLKNSRKNNTSGKE
ncbi:MAG TPA: tail fiber domain-containing protein [Ignavibacteria bacterium]|nr:tail fiber domain-containing protein [Ignavibacteria bacterium]